MNLITGLWGMNVHVPGQDVENLHWFFSVRLSPSSNENFNLTTSVTRSSAALVPSLSAEPGSPTAYAHLLLAPPALLEAHALPRRFSFANERTRGLSEISLERRREAMVASGVLVPSQFSVGFYVVLLRIPYTASHSGNY